MRNRHSASINHSPQLGILVFAVLIALTIACRLLPHPPNFTPAAAVALFAGFFFGRRAVALVVVLAAMALSDLIIGTYDYRIMAAVYAAFMFPVFLRSLLRRRLNPLTCCGSAIACSVVFFVSTNLAVWIFGGMYPPTLAGLGKCFTAALPFFRYTLCGDLFWTATLFGSYAIALRFATTPFAAKNLPARGTPGAGALLTVR